MNKNNKNTNPDSRTQTHKLKKKKTKNKKQNKTQKQYLTIEFLGLPNLVPLVTSPHRDHRQLSQNDNTTNGGGDFLAAVDAKSNVVVTVTDDDEGLETGTLTGISLLLNGHDFHNLIFEARAELIDDLVVLDWEGIEVGLLQRLNLVGFDETSELRDRDPFLLLLLATGLAPSTASPISPGTSSVKASVEATASSSTTLSHDFFWK